MLTGATHSLAQLRAGQSAISEVIRDQLPGATVGIDIISGQLLVTWSAETPPEVMRTMESRTSVPVTSDIVPLPSDGIDAHGGGRLTLGTDYSLIHCTSGFNVRQMDTGQTGITTAGHCENNARYWSSSRKSGLASLLGQRWDADQDAQWMDTGYIETAQFLDGDSLRTTSGSVGRSNQAGDYVCHFGQRTGYSCGTVTDIWFDPGDTQCNSGPCDAVWVKIEGPSLRCYGGDSGGPFFICTTAYGLYKGQSSNGTTEAGCFYSYYMAMERFLDPFTGLLLITG